MAKKLKINITIDEELNKRIEEHAEENYLNRSAVLSIAATHYLNLLETQKAVQTMAFSLQKIASKITDGTLDPDVKEELEDFVRLAEMVSRHS